MPLNVEKSGQQDQEYSQEWLVNKDPAEYMYLCHNALKYKAFLSMYARINFHRFCKEGHANLYFRNDLPGVLIVIGAPPGWLSGERVGLMSWWF